MPQIFDNIENHLNKVLKQTLEVSYRSDFCVGYFNLRGWKQVANEIDKWEGGENNSCRLLVGMQNIGVETLHQYFSQSEQNQEGLDFIINYDIKYRMGKELNVEE